MLHKRQKEESKTIWQGNIALCHSNRDIIIQLKLIDVKI